MGRKSKYTPEVVDKIVQALKLGAAYEDACNYAGISFETFRTWRARYPAFLEAIKAAEGQATVHWLAAIEKAAREGNWQAAAWKLERRYPDRYGRKERVDVKVTVRQEIERLVLDGVIDASDAEAAIAEAEALVRGGRG